MSERNWGLGRGVVWVFAGIGLIAAAAVIYLAVIIFGWQARLAPDPAPIRAEATDVVLTVAEVNSLVGTPFDEIVIAVDRTEMRSGSGSSSYSGGSPEIRNILLLDRRTGATRKLLENSARLVVERYYLPATSDTEGGSSTGVDDLVYEAMDGPSEENEPPRAYYVLRLRNAEDVAEDVLFGVLASGEQSFVLTDIAGIERIWMQSPTLMGLVIRVGEALHYRAVDMTSLRVVASHPIDIG